MSQPPGSTCRCESAEVPMTVPDEGGGFDGDKSQDPTALGTIYSTDDRGIYLTGRHG
jgi:hypothetical protein